MTSPTTATPNAARHPTAEKILQTLTTLPNATAADLAARTGLGRSTVTSHLAQLEKRGDAHRDTGGREDGRKLPDRWHLAATEPSTPPDAAPELTRLRPGQLDALVLDQVRDHAGGEPVGPTGVAAALGRSSGAVANCLTRLAARGEIRQVGDRPRRYSARSST